MDALSANPLPLELLVPLSFYVVLGIYAVFSGILYFHWKTYSFDAGVTRITLLSYAVLTIPLILIMAAVVFL